MRWSEAGSFLRETFEEWKEDNALQWGAALAYYATLSLAPLLLLLLSLTGVFYGREAAGSRIMERLAGWTGPEVAEALAKIVDNAEKSGSGWTAAVSSAVLLLGASGIFTQLKKALNHFWDVQPHGGGWKGSLLRKIGDRFLAFAMVLLSCLLVLVALASSAAISALTEYAEVLLPFSAEIVRGLQLAFSLGVFTLLLAVLLRFLPDGQIEWRDVWVGAGVTALLFVFGQWLLGLYLSHAGVGSTYGAAGSLVVLLVWIYYTAQILYVGAEITQVWARRYGSRIEPSKT